MFNKKLVFWSACLGMLLFGIGLITLGSVAPDLKLKYQLDDISAGTLFSILPFGILVGSLVFGPVCDKYGYRILLILSALLLFAGFEGLAFSPSKAILNICIIMIGVGGGAINGATNAVVADISSSEKGADLSLLGVFFGIGALGMPVLLGLLETRYDFSTIIAAVGFIALAATLLFAIVKFPQPKQRQGFPVRQAVRLLKEDFLLLVAFFLFFQSSFEGLINNWTTTYMIDHISVPQNRALFGLSAFVAGMTGMRLLYGSIFRSVPGRKILFFSFGIVLAALSVIKFSNTFALSSAGLALLGAGLAGGFPIMLGFVGNRYAALSGTAFSLVFVIALTGNMLVNYLMGVIAETRGIRHLPDIVFIELIIMFMLSLIIVKKLKTDN